MSRSIRAPFAVLAIAALLGSGLAAVAVAAGAAAAAPTAADYRLTELPAVDADTGHYPVAVANGIAVGNTIGFRDTVLPAFVWSAGTLSDLPAPTDSRTSRVEGVNASGLIIGEGYNADAIGSTSAQPMVWNASSPSSATVLAQPAGGASYGFGIAVNGSGQLLATQTPVANHGQVPYFYSSASAAPQQVGTGFDTTAGAGAIGLADSGVILAGATPIGGVAGYYLLPTPDATPAQSTLLDFRPTAISPNGTVVGTRDNATTLVVRSPAGVESTSSSDVLPWAVTDAGDLVGLRQNAPYTAVLVQRDGTVTDLGTFLPGWTNIGPHGIDADGDIVGSGYDPQGVQHGFILSHAASTDLSVSLAASPDRIAPAVSTTVTATIRNAGSATATGISVGLTSDPSANITIGSPSPASVASLAGGATTTVTWTVSASQEGTYQLTGALAWTDPSLGSRTASGQLSLPVADEGIVVNGTGDAALTDLATANKVCDTDDATAGNQCSLRAAIQLANLVGTAGTPAEITFDVPGGLPTITPASTLPSLTAPVVLDGTTQSGGWVQLSGAGMSGDGLTVTGGGSTVRGLVVNGFASGAGIVLAGAGHDRIVGNRIGTNAAGTAAVANNVGIKLGAPDSIIGALTTADLATTTASVCDGDCNVISGNTTRGVAAFDLANPTGANRSRIVGNVIGTNVTGTAAVPNDEGVRITDAQGFPLADVVAIGGTTSRPGLAPGNLISGNTDFGIATGSASGGDARFATIEGNLVGGNWAGTAAIGNGAGIAAASGSDVVGGGEPGQGNVVIGNQTGVEPRATVRGNIIGIGLSGTAVRNTVGINSEGGPLCDNVISGNGIGVRGHGSLATLAGGNRIGTNAAGTAAVPNEIGVADQAFSSAAPACPGTQPDVVSGNTIGGFVADGEDLGAVVQVSDIYIGTDITGTRAIPNGVGISVTAPDGEGHGQASIQLGQGRFPTSARPGSCATTSCVIVAGNTGAGILLTDTSGRNDQVGVQHASIGVGVDGRPLPNGGDGIRVDAGISPVFVQDGSPFGIADSVIANNGGAGFVVTASDRPDQLYPVTGTVFAANAGGNVSLADGTDFLFSGDTIRDAPSGLVVAGGAAPELTGNRMSGNATQPYAPARTVTAPGTPASLTVSRVGSSLVVRGARPTGTTGRYRIDVFGDAACTNGPQGATPLGSAIVTSAFYVQDFTIHVDGVPGGLAGISVTATDLDGASAQLAGRTSRYSGCLTAAATTTTATSPTTTATAGQSVTVHGSGFVPGETVDVSLHSDPVHLATTTADADGDVSIAVVIPSTTPAGLHHIVLTGQSSGATAEIAITVTRGALATTGTDPAAGIAAALLLLLAGLAVVAGRRMRQHERRSVAPRAG